MALPKTRIIIGSTAIKHWFPDFYREPKDLDTFQFPGFGDLPIDDYWDDRLMDHFGEQQGYATPNELYTIKVSHSHWDLKNGSWLKHIEDAAWLKKQGCHLDRGLYSLLYEIWEDQHGKKKVNIQMDYDDFFDDAVTRIYDHDSLHASVAYNDEPIFTRILKDGETIDIDYGKQWALSHEELLMLFREEVYATALERLLVPTNYRVSPRRAYAWSLRRTITSLTKGKSSLWMVENYDELRRPDVDYLQRHLDNKHKLIPIKEPQNA